MPTSVSDMDVNKTDKASQNTVHVDLGERSYDICIGPGLINEADRLILDKYPNSKCAIVTDENVGDLYLARLVNILEKSALYAGNVVLPAGESTKSFDNLQYLSEQLLKLGIERKDLVVALGGGVIGDIAGFAASILRRGVNFIQIPTSLLAQVDSSVGGKTGINTSQGKNLIGTFHQPGLVIADPEILDTLPERQFRAGYAEVAKYGLLGDAPFFSWLEQNAAKIFSSDTEERIYAIKKSCLAKAKIVAADELEAGGRALLNLGHTFGHALEAWAGYSDRLLHGEAISIGMVLAFEFSESLEFCANNLSDRVRAHFASHGLPTRIQEISGEEKPILDELINLISQDKKVVDGVPAFILVRDIGEAFVCRDIDQNTLRTFLQDKI